MARSGSYKQLAEAVLIAMQSEVWDWAKSIESDPFLEIERIMRELGMADYSNKPVKKVDRSKPPVGFKVTSRKEPNETGLSSMGQADRGREIFVNGKRIISISPHDKRATAGWYWYGGDDKLGIVNHNTLWREKDRIFPGNDDGLKAAESDARAYVIAQLWAAQKEKGE